MMRLILLRHGESIWNRDDRFTGWTDVDLSDKGVGEAHRAAALLKTHEIAPDWCCTTYLKRAGEIRSLVLILDDLHWADISSLLLLRFLVREMVESRLLVLATYRDVEVSRGIRWPRSCRRSGRNAPSSASSSEPQLASRGSDKFRV